MNTVIRAATESDIKQIADIEKASFSTPWSESALSQSLNPDNCFLVLADGECVIGYALVGMVVDDFAELYNIAIHPSYRKKGLSSILMTELINEAKAQSKDKILLEVRASNAPAIALYEKFGFVPDGIRRGYYSNPKEDGLLMSLTLN